MPFIEETRVESTQMFGTPTSRNMVEVIPNKTPVLGAMEQSVGVYQSPSMREKIRVFFNDPLLQEGVFSFAQQVLSTGVYFSGNPEYTKVLNGKTAVKFIEEWADKNDLNVKLMDITTELKAFGNSYWQINEFGFVKIPLEAVWRVVPIKDKTPTQYRYNLGLDPIYSGGFVEWGKFLHFRVNVVGYKSPFGIGMMDGMLARPMGRNGRNAPSLYDIRLSMRESLDEGFRKFSFGNIYVGFPNMSNEDFQNNDIAGKIGKMAATGNRIATNTDIKVALEVPQRTQSYDEFIRQMRNEFFMAIGDPSLKMGLEEGFTRATAISAFEMYKPRIAMMRLAIKQQLEDLFKQILNKSGYNGEEACVRLNFGPQEQPEYTVEQLAIMLKLGAINQAQTQHILINWLHWDIRKELADVPNTPSVTQGSTGIDVDLENLGRKKELPKDAKMNNTVFSNLGNHSVNPSSRGKPDGSTFL